MSDRLRWRAESAWAGIAAPGTYIGDGIEVDVLDRTPLATIVARPAQDAALADRALAQLGVSLPPPGKANVGADGALVWSAPNQWLAIGFADAALTLPEALQGVAAVTDQTDSRAIVGIGGPSSRDVLAKGFAIDLHPSVFATGSAAVTKVAYLSVQIWQIDDLPTYRISVPRSSASTFWSWLVGACGPLRAT